MASVGYAALDTVVWRCGLVFEQGHVGGNAGCHWMLFMVYDGGGCVPMGSEPVTCQRASLS